jgi:hemerythrin-like domain-containing protein
MSVEPVEILKREHVVILRVVDLLERELARLERGLGFDMAFARWTVDFFERFTDACHHGKEEAALFPLLEQRGIPRSGGPIAVMLAEHEEGRECVRRMARGVQQRDEQALAEAAARYCALLRQHISKENDVLFELAGLRLHPADAVELAEAFERIERERGGHPLHRTLLEELERWEHEKPPVACPAAASAERPQDDIQRLEEVEQQLAPLFDHVRDVERGALHWLIERLRRALQQDRRHHPS